MRENLSPCWLKYCWVSRHFQVEVDTSEKWNWQPLLVSVVEEGAFRLLCFSFNKLNQPSLWFHIYYNFCFFNRMVNQPLFWMRMLTADVGPKIGSMRLGLCVTPDLMKVELSSVVWDLDVQGHTYRPSGSNWCHDRYYDSHNLAAIRVVWVAAGKVRLPASTYFWNWMEQLTYLRSHSLHQLWEKSRLISHSRGSIAAPSNAIHGHSMVWDSVQPCNLYPGLCSADYHNLPTPAAN